MKVYELIAYLSQCDGDLEVCADFDTKCHLAEVVEVSRHSDPEKSYVTLLFGEAPKA